MNCREATALLSQAQDRALSVDERVSLKVHLLMCTGCRQYRLQLGALRQMARRMAQGGIPGEDGSEASSKP